MKTNVSPHKFNITGSLIAWLSCFTAVFSVTAADNNIDIFNPPARALPVAFSVPFTKGTLKNPSDFTISQNKNKLPVQARPISKWPDGSIRWCEAIIPPVSGPVTVVTGATADKPEVKNPVSVVKQNGTLILRNKFAEVSFKTSGETVDYNCNGNKFSFRLSEAFAPQRQKLTARIEQAEIMEQGPLRAVIRLRGWLAPAHKPGLRTLEVFLMLYADTPILEVRHIIGFAFEDPQVGHMAELTETESVSVPFTLPGDNNPAQVFMTDGSRLKLPAGERAVQWEYDSFELMKNSQITAKKTGQLNGVCLVPMKGGKTFVLSVVDLPEQFPAGVSRSTSGLSLELFPEIIPRTRYQKRKNEHIWYYYLRTGDYVIRQGVEKEHSFYVGIVDDSQQTIKAAAALQVLPVGLPDVDFLNRTGAWAMKLYKPDNNSARLDNAIKIGCNTYFDRQRKEKWYGLMNWGDWFGERDYNWGNQEYDTPAMLFDQAFRFRNPEYFREAIRGARHQIDIDTISSHADCDREGAVWAHCLGHTGGYYDKGFFKGKPSLFHFGRNTPGHTRVRGVADAYMLTGDVRFLEHAEKIADYLMYDDMFRLRNWNPGMTAREPGWLLFNLCAVYDASGNPKYLKAASKLADIVLEQAAGRGVRHTLLANPKSNAKPRPKDKMKDDPRLYRDSPNMGALSFPTAFQGAGMIEVYKRTGREDILENITETSRYIKRRLYRKQNNGFVHSPCPWRPQSIKIGGVAGNGLRYIMAFEYTQTKDPETGKFILDNLNEMFRKRECFGAKKECSPDYPTAKNISASLYFWPQTDECLKESGLLK